MPFRDVVGHRRLLSLLSGSIARGTLPPSLLFAGPEGVGKRRVAVAVAQARNCLTPIVAAEMGGAGAEGGAPPDLPIDACGQCAACRRIARALHPDVLIIEPQDSDIIKVEQLRGAIEASAYRPFEGRCRVVIVDPADAMETKGQDALLKTLEEPPSASIFILISAWPDALRPTVRSRCPRLRFGQLAATEISGVLMAEHGYGEREARAASAMADGSLGRALGLAAGDLADVREAACTVLHEVAGATDPRRRLESVRDLGKGPGKATPRGERESLAEYCRAIGSLLRDLSLLSARAQERALANVDLKAQLEDLRESYGHERTMRAFDAVDRALGALEQNASPKIVADWLALQL